MDADRRPNSDIFLKGHLIFRFFSDSTKNARGCQFKGLQDLRFAASRLDFSHDFRSDERCLSRIRATVTSESWWHSVICFLCSWLTVLGWWIGFDQLGRLLWRTLSCHYHLQKHEQSRDDYSVKCMTELKHNNVCLLVEEQLPRNKWQFALFKFKNRISFIKINVEFLSKKPLYFVSQLWATRRPHWRSVKC